MGASLLFLSQHQELLPRHRDHNSLLLHLICLTFIVPTSKRSSKVIGISVCSLFTREQIKIGFHTVESLPSTFTLGRGLVGIAAGHTTVFYWLIVRPRHNQTYVDFTKGNINFYGLRLRVFRPFLGCSWTLRNSKSLTETWLIQAYDTMSRIISL